MTNTSIKPSHFMPRPEDDLVALLETAYQQIKHGHQLFICIALNNAEGNHPTATAGPLYDVIDASLGECITLGELMLKQDPTLAGDAPVGTRVGVANRHREVRERRLRWITHLINVIETAIANSTTVPYKQEIPE